MKDKDFHKEFSNLPSEMLEYIELVAKRVRCSRKVRTDVARELACHFEDTLREFKDEAQKQEHAKKLIEEFGSPEVLAKLIRRGKKRCRPLWKKAIIACFKTIGILFALIILYGFYISTGKPEIKIDYVAELNRLNKQSHDESLNAAHDYQKAIDAFVKLESIEVDGEEQKRPYRFFRNSKNFSQISPENMKILRENISQNQKMLEYLQKGIRKPYCWREVESEDGSCYGIILPHLSVLRDMTFLLVLDLRLRADAGDVDTAIDGLIDLYRFGNHVGNGEYRTMIEWLVGVAIRGFVQEEIPLLIENHNLNFMQLQKIKSSLLLESCKTQYKPPYYGERMAMNDFIQRVYTDGGIGGGHLVPDLMTKYNELMGNAYSDFLDIWLINIPFSMFSAGRDKSTEEVGRWYGNYELQLQKIPWDIRDEDFEPEFMRWSRMKQARYWFVIRWLPALRKVNLHSYKARINDKAIITIISLHEYKLKNGEFPESLGELVKAELLEKVPRDPFGPGDLSYVKTEDSFRLYSYGENMQDDGGVIGKKANGKPQRWADNGDAVFWPVED